MPSSLIIVALAVAWLVVLVPMIARRRQEVAQTADSALAARIVHSGSARPHVGEEFAVAEVEQSADEVVELADRRAPRDIGPVRLAEAGASDDEEFDETDLDESDLDDEVALDEVEFDDEETLDAELDADDVGQAEGALRADVADTDDMAEAEPADPAAEQVRREPRPYRPGRGGFDPAAAAAAARARYAARQRVVLLLLLSIVATAVVAGFVAPVVWWAHGGVDLLLAMYLTYLRRQVRIEEEIRERRMSRMADARRQAPAAEPHRAERSDGEAETSVTRLPRTHRPAAIVVELDDEDPMFEDLDEPTRMVFRRAAG